MYFDFLLFRLNAWWPISGTPPVLMEQRDMSYYFSYLYCVPSRPPATKVEPALD
jgi:hypothetical protein